VRLIHAADYGGPYPADVFARPSRAEKLPFSIVANMHVRVWAERLLSLYDDALGRPRHA
jgi:hypothetical protein